jgi:hypothetical protein
LKQLKSEDYCEADSFDKKEWGKRGMTGVVFGKKEWSVVGVLALAIALLAAQASAATLAALTGIGSGTSAGGVSCTHSTNALCPGSDTCDCVLINGTGKAGSIGALKFSTTVVVDESLPFGFCFQTFGIATLTSSGNSKNSLVLDYTGNLCEMNFLLTQWTLNATFFVDGTASAGKFAGASGSGNLAGGENTNTGAVQGNINGTLLP